MIDQWLKKDLNQKLQNRNRIVILDPTHWGEFLLPLLEDSEYQVLRTNPKLTEHWQIVKEELLLRVEAEGPLQDKKVIFYATRPIQRLTFLFDYCFTDSMIDLSDPATWLRTKIKTATHINTQLEEKDLLLAGKLSIGKDIAWWKKVLQDPSVIYDLDKDILEFLIEPETYMNNLDPELRKVVEEKIFALLNQLPMEKPPTTLANELMDKVFQNVIKNTLSEQLGSIYTKCIDSHQCVPKMKEYMNNVKISPTTNPWEASPNHCFENIDMKMLQDILTHILDHDYFQSRLPYLQKRIQLADKNPYIPTWWADVVALLQFDKKAIQKTNQFQEVNKVYTESFCHIDRAMRNLYAQFQFHKEIIDQLQSFYETINDELLQKWYEFGSEYETTQNGFLINLFKQNKAPIAVIVGDGLRYEVANYVAQKLEKTYKIEKEVILADIPTETEHDMTLLYTGSDMPTPDKSDREAILIEKTEKTIDFIDLEKISTLEKPMNVVITYKDIDKIGESLQMNALPFFRDTEDCLIRSIHEIFKKGYQKIYLITDHGFVLTGQLTVSDKISAKITGKKEIYERYIRTKEKQKNTDLLEFPRKKDEFEYVYVAKNHRPYKTPGKYGYSHGGFTPQEVICPNFCFTKLDNKTSTLVIYIENKKELQQVTGQHFPIMIKAKESDKLFSAARKVLLVLFMDQKEKSRSNIITLQAGEKQTFEFSMDVSKEARVNLLDAETLELIDEADIKQSNVRDLGGLK